MTLVFCVATTTTQLVFSSRAIYSRLRPSAPTGLARLFCNSAEPLVGLRRALCDQKPRGVTTWVGLVVAFLSLIWMAKAAEDVGTAIDPELGVELVPSDDEEKNEDKLKHHQRRSTASTAAIELAPPSTSSWRWRRATWPALVANWGASTHPSRGRRQAARGHGEHVDAGRVAVGHVPDLRVDARGAAALPGPGLGLTCQPQPHRRAGMRSKSSCVSLPVAASPSRDDDEHRAPRGVRTRRKNKDVLLVRWRRHVARRPTRAPSLWLLRRPLALHALLCSRVHAGGPAERLTGRGVRDRRRPRLSSSTKPAGNPKAAARSAGGSARRFVEDGGAGAVRGPRTAARNAELVAVRGREVGIVLRGDGAATFFLLLPFLLPALPFLFFLALALALLLLSCAAACACGPRCWSCWSWSWSWSCYYCSKTPSAPQNRSPLQPRRARWGSSACSAAVHSSRWRRVRSARGAGAIDAVPEDLCA